MHYLLMIFSLVQCVVFLAPAVLHPALVALLGVCLALQMLMELGGAQKSAPVVQVVPGQPKSQGLALGSVVLPPYHRQNRSCYH